MAVTRLLACAPSRAKIKTTMGTWSKNLVSADGLKPGKAGPKALAKQLALVR
jgi:hypothetical protein